MCVSVDHADSQGHEILPDYKMGFFGPGSKVVILVILIVIAMLSVIAKILIIIIVVITATVIIIGIVVNLAQCERSHAAVLEKKRRWVHLGTLRGIMGLLRLLTLPTKKSAPVKTTALRKLSVCGGGYSEVSPQNGGNLYRAPYYNRNPNIGPRINSNLGQSPFIATPHSTLSSGASTALLTETPLCRHEQLTTLVIILQLNMNRQ